MVSDKMKAAMENVRKLPKDQQRQVIRMAAARLRQLHQDKAEEEQ